jgi:hypothetical protein
MADYIHMSNIIQGEVMRIMERRPLEQQPELLYELIQFLEGEITSITVTRLKATQELSEA